MRLYASMRRPYALVLFTLMHAPSLCATCRTSLSHKANYLKYDFRIICSDKFREWWTLTFQYSVCLCVRRIKIFARFGTLQSLENSNVPLHLQTFHIFHDVLAAVLRAHSNAEKQGGQELLCTRIFPEFLHSHKSLHSEFFLFTISRVLFNKYFNFVWNLNHIDLVQIKAHKILFFHLLK